MGLWGAAQAIAFGLGGLVGTGASDLARWTALVAPELSYACVFAFEGLLFLCLRRGSPASAGHAGSIEPRFDDRTRRSARRTHGLTVREAFEGVHR